MGEKGNLPIEHSTGSGLPKVGHPTAAKDPGAGFAAKDGAPGMAAKDPAVPTAAKDLSGFAAPPAAPAHGGPPVPGVGGFLAGREARRDDDPPVTGA